MAETFCDDDFPVLGGGPVEQSGGGGGGGGGDASAANQVIGNNLLTTIDADTSVLVTAIKAEDAAHVSGDAGVMSLAVRNDAGTALAANGDYIPLSTDATGNLRVAGAVTVTGGATAANQVTGNNSLGFIDGSTSISAQATKIEDSVHSTGDRGVFTLAVRNDAGTALAGDGDYIPFTTDSTGALRVTGGGGSGGDATAANQVTGNNLLTTINTSTGSIATTNATIAGAVKIEDAAHVSGDPGIMALAVRNDAGGPLAGATGDYIPLTTDSTGALRVTGGGGGGDATAANQVTGNASLATIAGAIRQEDAPHVSGDTGVLMLGVRNDSGGTLASANGDNTPMQFDSAGALRVTTTAASPSAFVNFSTATSFNLKGSSGSLVSVNVSNSNATVRYLQVHNTAVAPTAGAVPILSFPIPAGTAAAPAVLVLDNGFFGEGLSMATGVSLAVSSTLGTYTAATNSEHVVNATYR